MCGMRCVWELGWEVRVGRDGCAPGGDECWTKAKLVGGAGGTVTSLGRGGQSWTTSQGDAMKNTARTFWTAGLAECYVTDHGLCT